MSGDVCFHSYHVRTHVKANTTQPNITQTGGQTEHVWGGYSNSYTRWDRGLGSKRAKGLHISVIVRTSSFDRSID